MSVKIDIREVERAIEKELSSTQSTRVQNLAINKGAKKVADNLSNTFSKFRGTKLSIGATADEVTVGTARKTVDGRRAKIGWSGSKGRYRLIHLNEWGYTRKGKRYKPRMFGLVQNTLDKSEREYFDIVGKELADGYTKYR